MKKISILIFLLVTAISVQETHAQKFPKMDISPMDLALARPDKNSDPIARVIYSRPQKKGRQIFGNLVPYDQVWRTGANEATELTIYEPLQIGNTVLQPRDYTLYSIPGETVWTIIINGDTNVWGAYSYKKEKDVVRIKVPTKSVAAPIEDLSMIFRPEKDGTTLLIGWDDVYVEVPFKNVP